MSQSRPKQATPRRKNLFLVGPMGAGKSTVGRLVAGELGLCFIDCDQEMEARTGVGIPWIFDKEGEGGFRDREQNLLDELTRREGVALATGGGAVLRPQNRAALTGRGVVVYLTASPQRQAARTARDNNRPLLLQTDDPEARLQALAAERDPLYRSVADHVVSTEHRTPAEVVTQVLELLLDEFAPPGV